MYPSIIELIAALVILSIIVLISVPIVVNIIDKSTKITQKNPKILYINIMEFVMILVYQLRERAFLLVPQKMKKNAKKAVNCLIYFMGVIKYVWQVVNN